jgi:metal-responsive CopG/Arc/MetJ family transcriptional regulator
MADNAACEGFEGRSISLPVKLWGLLERLKKDRQDATLSDTVRVLLLGHLAENSYLEDREKKALGVTT